MADNYKILAQTTAASNEELGGSAQANVVYTVPASTQASISSVSLINSSTTSENYYLGVVKAADVSSSSTVGVYNHTLIWSTVLPSYNLAYTEDNGETWTEFAFPNGISNYWEVVYGDGKFIVTYANNTTMYYSTDGITWTAFLSPDGSSPLYATTYVNRRFFGDGAAGVYTSENGIDWTLTDLPDNVSTNANIAYGNGVYVLTSYGNTFYYSTDGLSWLATPSPESIFGSWYSPAYGNGVFVAASYDSYQSPYGQYRTGAYSTDGINWIGFALPEPGSPAFPLNAFYGSAGFLIGTNDSFYWYSADGISWNYGSHPYQNLGQHGAYVDGTYILAGPSLMARSTDLVTWEYEDLSNKGFGILYSTPSTFAYADRSDYPKNIISDSQKIIPTRSIEANTVDEIVGGITLSAGDQIRVYSESPDLIVQVYGVEIA